MRNRGVRAFRSSNPPHTAATGLANMSFTTNTTNDDDDEQFKKSYTLNGVGKGSRVEMTTNTGHELHTDVPLKMGGTDSAPQPVETLLAALLGCTQATAIFVGRHLEPRILIERLEFVDIVAERDERGALTLPIETDPSDTSSTSRKSLERFECIREITKEKEPPPSSFTRTARHALATDGIAMSGCKHDDGEWM